MPSYLDLALLLIVAVSALLSMVRGFTREVLAIASWGAAAIAAYYLYPLVLPYVTPYIAKETDRPDRRDRGGLLRDADHRVDRDGQAVGSHPGQQGRRARPDARLPVRRGPRLPARRRGLSVLQLAGAAQQAAANGSPPPSPSRCCRRPATNSSRCCPRTPKTPSSSGSRRTRPRPTRMFRPIPKACARRPDPAPAPQDRSCAAAAPPPPPAKPAPAQQTDRQKLDNLLGKRRQRRRTRSHDSHDGPSSLSRRYAAYHLADRPPWHGPSAHSFPARGRTIERSRPGHTAREMRRVRHLRPSGCGRHHGARAACAAASRPGGGRHRGLRRAAVPLRAAARARGRPFLQGGDDRPAAGRRGDRPRALCHDRRDHPAQRAAAVRRTRRRRLRGGAQRQLHQRPDAAPRARSRTAPSASRPPTRR